MRRLGFQVCAALALGLASVSGAGHAQEPPAIAGQVKTLTGSATLTRAGQSEPITAGMNLLSGDQLATAADASLGVTLRDDTTLSLGPNARLTLDSFVFDPAADKLGLAARLHRGTFAVLTGQIARLAPDRTKFTTPSANIGIRGTKFVVKVEGDE
ncbi:hypothetical protein VZ95_00970 [Elstera litoralis]|uniref:FecR protein domain-containing protein n=1 Tax=Elstera litoralis TaxID=552518 RepID=A0A0F3IWB1_9PROT|nr:FecR domain-containing protein [Elstera litoralis]KJV11040.1 hypothetical protein VZ95_00970 [Elstera litoralis]